MSNAKPNPSKPTTGAAKSQVVYTLNEQRQIIRTDGEGERLLATLGEDGALVFASAETRRYLSKVAEFLNDEKVTWKPELVSVAPPEGASPEEIEEADISSEHTDAYNAKIPRPPKMKPEQGDKTPKYVEWLQQYKPKTYKATYGVKGPGRVTKYRDDEDPRTGRPVKVAYQVDAIIADRKTHLTEKPEAQVEVEDEDDNS